MEYPSIRILGNIISSETLDKIRNEEIKYQQPIDFGLDKKTGIREEIGIAWSATRAHWTAFKLRLERLKPDDSGTKETRSSWMIPLLQELGYEVEKANAFIHPDTGKSFAISHRAANLSGFPIHVMGYNDDLDKRRETSGPRLSPHALTQEYLNNTEHTYALVTNGRFLRLLRDATRLVRLSYLEFDLEKMMEEDQYNDFAVMYRLLHATRMPKQPDATEECFIEFYHQESLASGSRIRERLSNAVENSIKLLANGFLKHEGNWVLRDAIRENRLSAAEYYQLQLRLIYRLLFLIVIEERNLIYLDTKQDDIQRKRKIYYEFYSIERLRKLASKMHYVDGRKYDLWEGLKATFQLFVTGYYGEKLEIKPLGAGIFAPDALGYLDIVKLDNETLLKVIQSLTLFENESKQLTRVNYSDLDVEEFGSVYEGLLEYDAKLIETNGQYSFTFVKGTGRASSGSHYTPEELVKPLIKHSLEYVIEERIKERDKENALLSIKVCDVACGSGHILLSAARRIALELARVRMNEDQPAPTALRHAIRDVVLNCIYGVDKNPLAVELCKVALWLESHNPGEPLNFLDHRIKCGDSIVGLAHKDELLNGIPDEAFKTLPGDDKDVASTFRKANIAQRKQRSQTSLPFDKTVDQPLTSLLNRFDEFNAMPERTPDEIAKKQQAYGYLTHSKEWNKIKELADIQVAQFFIPKTESNKPSLVTDADYTQLLNGHNPKDARVNSTAMTVAFEKRFFHWFLEFPEVFVKGGFDCIVGNPPYLGDRRLKEILGEQFLEWIRYRFTPNSTVDLVVYFLLRIANIIRTKGFLSIITTNTVAQGKAREEGLEKLLSGGWSINHAVKSMKWPGVAAVEVALLSMYDGKWNKSCTLNLRPVNNISPFFDDAITVENPYSLERNASISYQGSIVLGLGFVLESDVANRLISKNTMNAEVVKPYLNGEDLNSSHTQAPNRWVIDFRDLPLQRASQEDWDVLDEKTKELYLRHGIFAHPSYTGKVARDYPDCLNIVETLVKPERTRVKLDENGNLIEGDFQLRSPLPQRWWRHAELRPALYSQMKQFSRILVSSRVSKFVNHSFITTNYIYDVATSIVLRQSYWEYSILQSSIHEIWARKYASTLESRIRYTNGECIDTFPFPVNLLDNNTQCLEKSGNSYYEHRKHQMLQTQLGLTKTYNLFHSQTLREITPEEAQLDDKPFEKMFGKDAIYLRKHLAKTPGTCTFNEAVAGIVELRRLHVEMDNAVLAAYGWQDIDLRHDFYEVDYLPEDDRIRYTIHPDARREILKHLLELNHRIHDEEMRSLATQPQKVSKRRRKSESDVGQQNKLF